MCLSFTWPTGTPQQTGTATLIIHLLDENDNAPLLKDNKVTICSSESMTNITAVDPDLPPFTTPFIYELEDNKGEWKIEPSIGKSKDLENFNKLHTCQKHRNIKQCIFNIDLL